MTQRGKHPGCLELLERLTEEQKNYLRRMSLDRPAYFSLREAGTVLGLAKLGLCNKVIDGLHREGYGLQAVLTSAGMELAASLAEEEEEDKEPG